ncbi:hypothetical protein [Lactiplantibacillus plantarum]|uniref:hypothetical protein n=1 Tax=Lactiplantibacillus plantarum TaxID=1590 RepID=UPI002000AD6B|nr:hypothetical protein [Lactiplantibacillus plantarum]
MKKMIEYLKNLSTKKTILVATALILLYQPAGTILAALIQNRFDVIKTVLFGAVVQLILASVLLLIIWLFMHQIHKLVLHFTVSQDE